MALTATTLSGGIDASATILVLASGTSVVVGTQILLDSEKLVVQDISLTPQFKVARGQGGTAAVAHDTLAPAVHGPAADFVIPKPERIYSYGVDGAITIQPGEHLLTKATAGAYTIAAPSQSQNGIVLKITSRTDAAHVITAPSAIIGDGTTGANVTLTFAAYIGASVTLIADNGKWNTLALEAVTPAA
ncbi:MAG: hypothetical protein NUW22_07530 [Acidobacteria bacterium]|nr:hypothetical protein [Acidobacteriota bacterium]